ncbi:MAG: sigma-70 family RNA polymerase sigma factor [Acidobacteria bacterium]|nr:sigma-70 family RNA polymerase sigma factor [Acidobacteriota bacterium]
MTGPRHPASPTLGEAVRCPLLEGDLEQWVRCCTCRFLPLARRVAGNDDVAHDALQQSWVLVLEKLQQYRGGSPACGWVGAIVRHEALHGATARRRERSLDATSGEVDSIAERTAVGVVSESPEAAAYARELTRLLLEVIDELPPTFREVVRLRDVDRRPPQEVARRLHISTGNVAVRLHRAHKLLRPRLLRRIAGASSSAIRPDKKNL